MNITLPIVNVDEEEFERYVAALEESNISRMICGEIKDLLKTARWQTEEAIKMGWL